MVAPTNASKWRMAFNSAFKGLIEGPDDDLEAGSKHAVIFAVCI